MKGLLCVILPLSLTTLFLVRVMNAQICPQEILVTYLWIPALSLTWKMALSEFICKVKCVQLLWSNM